MADIESILDLINKLDFNILKFFQKKADYVQDLTGIRSFFLTYICMGAAAFFALITCIERIETNNFPTQSIIALIILVVLFSVISSINEHRRRYGHEGVVLIFALILYIMRLSGLIITLLSIFFDLLLIPTGKYKDGISGVYPDAIFMFYAMCLYFCSCTPKSPRKSRFKKLIEKIKSISLVPQLSPVQA